MEASELIFIDSRKVRSDSNLMSIYIEAYQKQFGRKPNCAGCTFADDWKRFILAVRSGNETTRLTSNKKVMEQTFKLRKSEVRILTYRVNGKPHRLYTNRLTESFVVDYLTHGTPEEIKERKALFSILPEALRDEPSVVAKKPKFPDSRIMVNGEQVKPREEVMDDYIKAENKANETGSEEDKQAAKEANDILSDFDVKNDLIVKDKKTRAKRGSKKNK